MRHLIVISVDALVFEDLEFASSLPNFKYLIENGSQIKKVRTIYPSLTHPVHASILTGATAGKTGIINNRLFDINEPDGVSDAWYNNLSDIKCDTLIHAAKRAGMTVAASSFPLTSCPGDYIDYLLPNALNFYFDESNDAPLDIFKKLGASDSMLQIIEEGIKLYGHRDEHPWVDRLQVFCATEIIKRFKPGLLLTHPSHVDHMRHGTGVFSNGVKAAIAETDGWIGMLINATKEAGIFENCDFVVLSDHGQINITRIAFPNLILKNEGFIKCNSEGKVTEWQAYVNGAGASAQVYLSDKKNLALKDAVYSCLLARAKEGLYGFNEVFCEEELRDKYGLSGDFSFVLEGDGFTGFRAKVGDEHFSYFDYGNYSKSVGTHGHRPDKGPQPTFIGCGPGFKKGVIIEEGNILNHAPTLAKLLGVELRDAEGVSVDEILANI